MNTATKSYGIDGWCGNSGTELILEDGYVSIVNKNPTETASFVQFIETGKQLYGKTVTLSALMHDGALITTTADLPASALSVNTNVLDAGLPDNLGHLSLRLYTDSTSVLPSVTLWQSGNSVCGIVAVRLDPGPFQTLAHQDADGNWVLNNPRPNKALELLRCQRYQIECFDRTSDRPAYLGIFTAVSASKAYGLIPLPVAMRPGGNPAINTTLQNETNPWVAFGVFASGYIDRVPVGSIVPYSLSSTGLTASIVLGSTQNEGFSSGAFVKGNSYELYCFGPQKNESFLLDRNL